MLLGERSCSATNRMRELRSCGSVRAEGSNVLGYSETPRGMQRLATRSDMLHPATTQGDPPGVHCWAGDPLTAPCQRRSRSEGLTQCPLETPGSKNAAVISLAIPRS